MWKHGLCEKCLTKMACAILAQAPGVFDYLKTRICCLSLLVSKGIYHHRNGACPRLTNGAWDVFFARAHCGRQVAAAFRGDVFGWIVLDDPFYLLGGSQPSRSLAFLPFKLLAGDLRAAQFRQPCSWTFVLLAKGFVSKEDNRFGGVSIEFPVNVKTSNAKTHSYLLRLFRKKWKLDLVQSSDLNQQHHNPFNENGR